MEKEGKDDIRWQWITGLEGSQMILTTGRQEKRAEQEIFFYPVILVVQEAFCRTDMF